MSNDIPLPDGITAEDLAAALELVRQRKSSPAARPRPREGGDEETIFVRGEGGAVFEMAPSRMTPDMRRRLQLGYLRRVDRDGRPLRTPAPAPAPASEGTGAGGSALTQGRVPRPAKSAPKADWVLYAVTELGLDPERAEGMTRQDLMDLPADHDQHDPFEPPEDTPAPGAGDRPPQSAPKAQWIDYTVRRGLLSREDAVNYTKDDLIDLAS